MAKDKPTADSVIDEQPTQNTVVAEPVTQEQLMAQLQAALTAGDFKAVAKVSRAIDSLAKAAEKSELAAKHEALQLIIDSVKDAIMSAVQPLYEAGDLDSADGVWFSWDFGEQAPVLRLTKTAPRARTSGGGGTGKKFDVSTDDMLSRHGQEQFNDELTFAQAWEQSTEKNWRYGIRKKLLKLEGVIS